MKFAPKPENDFWQFIRLYYNECRARVPRIEAIAGKWMFRDLAPGMSDFDTRFIVNDAMTTADWCAMSDAVGEVHLSLCRKYPSWVRNLEHLPGVNLAWDELTGERSYYPEYQQWSFYDTETPQRLSAALAKLGARPWDVKDEHFHLKKFCLYYGRYNRTIDNPINMGVHENKYPMHSRLMHYFAPPVQSAMCVLLKQHLVGKYEALEIAARKFPNLACWDAVWEILHANYETPEWYAEPRLSELEDMLEQALTEMARAIRDVTALVPASAGLAMPQWKAALAQVPLDPALVIFDNAKFSRLMKGRLRFYARAPAYFDAEFLIRHELRRTGPNFFVVPFQTFWKLRTGQAVEDPTAILDRLDGLLSAEEIDLTRRFRELTRAAPAEGRTREAALAVADVFDGFFSALTKISRAAADLSDGLGSASGRFST